MLRELRPALVMLVLITLLTGLAYPLAMTGIASVLFHDQAEGSIVYASDGKTPVGSALIGQNFTSAKYFHGRPSATTDTDPNDATKTIAAPYNAANSGASNYGPTSKALADRVKDDIAKLKAENPDAPAGPVPADLVTTSASGLDPDISPEGAAYQIARVAKARSMSQDQVRQIVAANTTSRLFGIIGEPHVNVLALNRALDAAK
jgi:K+-transporting ATPase ATPase C chain